MNPDVEPEDRVYAEIKDIDSFYSVAESQLEEYNNVHKTRMNLVIFRLRPLSVYWVTPPLCMNHVALP